MSSPGERRRLARIPLSCRVVVGERFSSWVTRTQDVGPRGCRLETIRPVRTGTLLQLRLELEGSQAPLEAVGQVVWTREAPVLEAGVAFTGSVRGGAAGSTAWLDRLLAAELRRAWREGRRVGPLGEVHLHLGSAPGVRLDDDALAVLRGVRAGEPIARLVRTGAALDAVLRLLATGTITAIRANIDPEGWRRAFAVFSDFAKQSEEPRRPPSVEAPRRDPSVEAPRHEPPVIVLPPVPEADRPRVRAIEALLERYLREPG